jgi:hypothetical protein
MMSIILILVTFFCGLGIFQNKKTKNRFGMAVSSLACLVFLFSTILSFVV